MNILYTKRFSKDLDAVEDDVNIKRRLLDVIDQIKKIDALSDLSDIKKIRGYTGYFRIRLGDYRLGLKLTDNGVEMIRFLHRKEIYRKFP